MSFQLCATFNADSTSNSAAMSKPIYAGDTTNENWQHGTGEVCFDRTIDPDKYPPYSKPMSVR